MDQCTKLQVGKYSHVRHVSTYMYAQIHDARKYICFTYTYMYIYVSEKYMIHTL